LTVAWAGVVSFVGRCLTRFQPIAFVHLYLLCDKIILLTDVGRRRRVDCQRCDGPAAGNLLLSPLALASGRDGALYIGDYNYIRRLSPARDDVATILQLR